MNDVAHDRRTEMAAAVGVGEVRPKNYAAVAAMFAGVLLLVLLPLVPAPPPITEAGMGRIGLLLFATLWWVAAPVPLPVTTIAALAWGVLTGVLSVEEAFSAD